MILEHHSSYQNRQLLLRGILLFLLLVDSVFGFFVARNWDLLRCYILSSGRCAVTFCLVCWGIWLLITILTSSSWTFGLLIRLLSCNVLVLSVFCGVWYWGFYMSKYWMRIIDVGAPWSWFAALFVVSYVVSFLPLRLNSKAVAKSLVGPMITAPAFGLWVVFCAIKFDPFF